MSATTRIDHSNTMLFGIALLLFLILPISGYAQQIISSIQNNALRDTLKGTWTAEVGGSTIKLILNDSGTFSLAEAKGTYRIENAMLILSDNSGNEQRYSLSFQGKDVVTISGGDISQLLKFTRLPETAEMLKTYIRLDPRKIRDKLISIGIIILITGASRLLLRMVKILSAFLIFSNWSILKYLYADNKNRKETINSLILNLLKYIVYFTAIGFILSEIGVNYTTYLASLSVVGLAIGFGSQGLVQDIVTGFFLIFEGQFDVGDMVEISGQMGLVREMGLRMTKIQNYQGQIIFIPNRNIAVAGKYVKGCLEGYLDISLQGKSDYARAKRCVVSFSNELNRQFDEIFLDKAHVEPILALKTGEFFLRLHISIWPGQNWVIDQQMIPRIRELFTRENIVIPSDRIVSFYHLRSRQTVSKLSERFRRLRPSKAKRKKSKLK